MRGRFHGACSALRMRPPMWSICRRSSAPSARHLSASPRASRILFSGSRSCGRWRGILHHGLQHRRGRKTCAHSSSTSAARSQRCPSGPLPRTGPRRCPGAASDSTTASAASGALGAVQLGGALHERIAAHVSLEQRRSASRLSGRYPSPPGWRPDRGAHPWRGAGGLKRNLAQRKASGSMMRLT